MSSDYEQIVPEIYRIASYLDLYLIDSFGQDRKFIQIFNKFDPCCYSGTGYKSYELILEEKINSIQPADFEIFLEIDERFGQKVIELLNNYDDVELIKDLADKDRYVYARR